MSSVRSGRARMAAGCTAGGEHSGLASGDSGRSGMRDREGRKWKREKECEGQGGRRCEKLGMEMEKIALREREEMCESNHLQNAVLGAKLGVKVSTGPRGTHLRDPSMPSHVI